jgi:hypothetical protein
LPPHPEFTTRSKPRPANKPNRKIELRISLSPLQIHHPIIFSRPCI